MAARASRSAHLAAVDALTEQDHLSRRAFRNGKIARSRPGVWMRALWRLRGHFNGIAGRGCCARTCRDVRGTAYGAAMIDDPVARPTYIVGNLERTVRSYSQARGTMCVFSWRLHLSIETIRKY